MTATQSARDNCQSPRTNLRGNGRRSPQKRSESPCHKRTSPRRRRDVIPSQYCSPTPRDKQPSRILEDFSTTDTDTQDFSDIGTECQAAPALPPKKHCSSKVAEVIETWKKELDEPQRQPNSGTSSLRMHIGPFAEDHYHESGRGQGTHHSRNARLRRPSQAEHLRVAMKSSGSFVAEEWLAAHKLKPAQAAFFSFMRVVASSERHLDEMRRRLMLCTAFEPELFFHNLHADPSSPKDAPVTAEDLRFWLTQANEFPIRVCGQDVEALIMRYTGGKELNMAGFLHLVTPRDWRGRGGKEHRLAVRRVHRSQYGNPARAAHSQASIRLAQLLERELQLIREALVRQRHLFRLRLYPDEAMRLIGVNVGCSWSKEGISLVQEGFRKSFSACVSTPLNLTFEEQTALVQYLSSTPGSEMVTTEEWDRFMRLGDQFTSVKEMDIKAFTEECRVCSARIQRPYVSCPDCGQKMYGPIAEFATLSQLMISPPKTARNFAQ